MAEAADANPAEEWGETTVTEGSQGPRGYQVSPQQLRPTSRRRLGEIHWAIWSRNVVELRKGSGDRYALG